LEPDELPWSDRRGCESEVLFAEQTFRLIRAPIDAIATALSSWDRFIGRRKDSFGQKLDLLTEWALLQLRDHSWTALVKSRGGRELQDLTRQLDTEAIELGYEGVSDAVFYELYDRGGIVESLEATPERRGVRFHSKAGRAGPKRSQLERFIDQLFRDHDAFCFYPPLTPLQEAPWRCVLSDDRFQRDDFEGVEVIEWAPAAGPFLSANELGPLRL
jgi:hypothetical protein